MRNLSLFWRPLPSIGRDHHLVRSRLEGQLATDGQVPRRLARVETGEGPIFGHHLASHAELHLRDARDRRWPPRARSGWGSRSPSRQARTGPGPAPGPGSSARSSPRRYGPPPPPGGPGPGRCRDRAAGRRRRPPAPPGTGPLRRAARPRASSLSISACCSFSFCILWTAARARASRSPAWRFAGSAVASVRGSRAASYCPASKSDLPCWKASACFWRVVEARMRSCANRLPSRARAFCGSRAMTSSKATWASVPFPSSSRRSASAVLCSMRCALLHRVLDLALRGADPFAGLGDGPEGVGVEALGQHGGLGQLGQGLRRSSCFSESSSPSRSSRCELLPHLPRDALALQALGLGLPLEEILVEVRFLDGALDPPRC